MEKKFVTWNDVAESYSFQRENRAYSTIMESPTVMKMIGDVKNKKLLDAGCGGGLYTFKLQENGAKVIGFDISRNMIKYAKNKANSMGTPSNFLLMNATNLGFKSEIFDIIVAPFLLDNIPNYENAIREFWRVLKYNGKLVLSLPHPTSTSFEVVDEDPLFTKAMKDYFKQREKIKEWTIDNKSVEIMIYHRPQKAYMRSLLQTGFVLDDYDEPEPQPPPKMPEYLYNERNNTPAFLVLRAVKLKKETI